MVKKIDTYYMYGLYQGDESAVAKNQTVRGNEL